MALEYWEIQQRESGNIAGAEMARVLREQYGDSPLPNGQVIEKPAIEIKRFTAEATQLLIAQGYKVHELTGQSIKSLREAGQPFWPDWHENYPDFENLTSRLSEVAINPDPKKFFLPKSNNKTLKQQAKLIEDFSRKLKISGTAAILGEAPDYIELAFTHLDKTGERLFGEKYGYNYARTKTPTVDSHVAHVGNFHADHGLSVSGWYPGGGGNLFAVPLVVPA